MLNDLFADLTRNGSRENAVPVTGRAETDRFRDAARAIAELRRGAAVVIRDDDRACAVAAAETVETDRLDDWRGWLSGPPLLLWPADAAGAFGETLAATALPDARLTAEEIRRLAEPGRQRPTPEPAPIPGGAAAAAVLAKLARLLPTLIAGPVDSEGLARARFAGAIVVEAADIFSLRESAGAVERVGEARVPLEDAARARVVAYRHPASGTEHVAIVIGAPERRDGGLAPLVRLHSECFTGDVLGSLRCDCGPQLRAAMRRMADEGAGVVLYLAQEGRGIGLLNKLRAYALQDRGLDTLDANAALGFRPDERDFAAAATMLRDLGLSRIRLMTNNPAKIAALASAGLAVERASLLVAPNGVNDDYLATKATRFGHLSE